VVIALLTAMQRYSGTVTRFFVGVFGFRAIGREGRADQQREPPYGHDVRR